MPSGDLELPLLLALSCPEVWVRNKIKSFIKNFCTYDFTKIIHNDDSSNESDIEIDLRLAERKMMRKKLKH